MARKWIKSATENSHGQFKAKAKAAGESTKEFADEHSGDSSKTGKQARLTKALMSMHKGKSKDKAEKPSSKSMRNKLYGSKE